MAVGVGEFPPLRGPVKGSVGVSVHTPRSLCVAEGLCVGRWSVAVCHRGSLCVCTSVCAGRVSAGRVHAALRVPVPARLCILRVCWHGLCHCMRASRRPWAWVSGSGFACPAGVPAT